ncbi:MAG TPA: hypothetical protein VMQ59_13600, partial [Acidimicrobiales bacterium]|nr:hypothetical protein [Acidimicrobiales bacterium]
MAGDLLLAASWSCCATAPGAATAPGELDKVAGEWVDAPVPGTAAGAMAASSGWRHATTVDFDLADWWFRCRLPAGGDGRWTLTFDGLATIADVWFGGDHVLHSENMFVPGQVDLEAVSAGDEIVMRFAALTPLLGVRRPRPRWKTQMANHQALRWFRTTYLGRQPGWAVTPAPVGPWRPVRLEPAASPRVVGRRVVATCDDHDDGVVSVMVRLAGLRTSTDNARVRVRRVDGAAPGTATEASAEGPLAVHREGDDIVVEGDLAVPGIERWWPHTHGAQPLYAVSVEMGDETVEVGRVGFRTVVLDRTDGAFRLTVNGVAVFCRGACWWPVDPVGLHADDDDLRATLELVVQA